jgi:hypothetical protein
MRTQTPALALDLECLGCAFRCLVHDESQCVLDFNDGTVKLIRIVRDDPFDLVAPIICQQVPVTSCHTRKERVRNRRW